MRICLAAAGPELTKRAVKPIEGSVYRRLYYAIVDGRLPAQRINNKYEIDLDAAAAALGIELKKAA